MLITPTQVQVALDRQQVLVAAVVRDRLIVAAIQPPTTATPRPVGRARTSLRQAVAALVAALIAPASIS